MKINCEFRLPFSKLHHLVFHLLCRFTGDTYEEKRAYIHVKLYSSLWNANKLDTMKVFPFLATSLDPRTNVCEFCSLYILLVYVWWERYVWNLCKRAQNYYSFSERCCDLNKTAKIAMFTLLHSRRDCQLRKEEKFEKYRRWIEERWDRHARVGYQERKNSPEIEKIEKSMMIFESLI